VSSDQYNDSDRVQSALPKKDFHAQKKYYVSAYADRAFPEKIKRIDIFANRAIFLGKIELIAIDFS
jgi:hypothetical protein